MMKRLVLLLGNVGIVFNKMPIPLLSIDHGQYAVVFNRREWEFIGIWSGEQLDKTDQNGFIGSHKGVKCYLSKSMPVIFKNI